MCPAPGRYEHPGARDELRRHLRGGRRFERGDARQRGLLAGRSRPLWRGRPGDRIASPPGAREPGRRSGLGYPGGAALEELARAGDAEAFSFPGSNSERARGGWGTSRNSFAQGLDFSFAGVKTALLYRLRELSPDDARARAADLAASYQA